MIISNSNLLVSQRFPSVLTKPMQLFSQRIIKIYFHQLLPSNTAYYVASQAEFILTLHAL